MLRKLLSLFGGSDSQSGAMSAHGQVDNNAPIEPEHPELVAGDDRRSAHAWGAAARHYRAYLQDQPEDFAIWVQLGHALKEDHRMSDADDAYARARRLQPNNADLLLNYGHLKKLRGDLLQAAALYGASAEIHPGRDVIVELQAPLIHPHLTDAQKKIAATGRAL